MGRLFSHGGTVLGNDRGSILIITAFLVMILTLLLAGMVEVSRVMITRERLQTAADAASLASAGSEVKRWVQLTVTTTDRRRWTCCGDEECSPCCVSLPDCIRTVKGEERSLIEDEGWRRYCCGGSCGYNCDYTIEKRWIEYGRKTGRGDTAGDFFEANYPAGVTKAEIKKIIAYDDSQHPAYPSVIVYAAARVKSLFPGLFNAFPEGYNTLVCSQGNTYYKDPRSKKWVKPPEDWCWVDW